LNVLCLVKYYIYLLLWKTTQTSRRRLPAVPFLGTQGANGLINIWNSLPCHRPIVNSPTLSTFTSRLQNHDLSSWLIELYSLGCDCMLAYLLLIIFYQ